jgi:hypothetical protein
MHVLISKGKIEILRGHNHGYNGLPFSAQRERNVPDTKTANDEQKAAYVAGLRSRASFPVPSVFMKPEFFQQTNSALINSAILRIN